MNKIITMEDLIKVCRDRWIELADIKEGYLSDKGRAAMEAYRAIVWHASFHQEFKTLIEDPSFKSLSNVEDKDHEYYKILRMCNKAIRDAIKRKEG